MTRNAEAELLTAGASELGIALGAAPGEKLLCLVDELEAGNAQFNLTAIRDRLGMLHKHVLDSLSLQTYLRGSRIADVGTGAGFSRTATGHHQSAAAVFADRGHREKGTLRAADGRAHRLRQRGCGERAR